ncbi:class I SAM-dependent methyltransferase [Salinigranum marinum]|uniref:class I SAM-dependent methyltransferase n=1 Tax=Salinigranum marinum TaxID=1515595 RepID=UPI002989AA8D|nr:class I SAM-dependent methyltransferase [Salinigranum marinum]
MATQVIYDRLSERFDSPETPPWYDDAVLRLRGGAYRSYGLYLYNLVRRTPSIETIVNVGTARGFSAVCAARAVADREAGGAVHTIDVQSPGEPRDWHVKKHDDDDPARGRQMTVHELVEPFATDGGLPLRHHTGDSLAILSEWDGGSIDLIFHDGRHTYEHVRREIELGTERGGQTPPIHVFDDCFLYENEWTRWFVTDTGPFEYLNSLPYLRRLPEYALIRKRAAGVARAVGEAFEDGEWGRLEIVRDDWAPITALVP